jgi:hypothetical protein
MASNIVAVEEISMPEQYHAYHHQGASTSGSPWKPEVLHLLIYYKSYRHVDADSASHE